MTSIRERLSNRPAKIAAALSAILMIAPALALAPATRAEAYFLMGCKVPGGANVLIHAVPPSIYSTPNANARANITTSTDATMLNTTNYGASGIDSYMVFDTFVGEFSGRLLADCFGGPYWAPTPTIQINRAYTDSYTASMKQSVIAHEMGHLLGLAHHNNWPPLLMDFSDYVRELSGIYTVQPDDIAGINSLY